MLDCDVETIPAVDEINRLPCSVIIPAGLLEKFELQGPAPSLPGCKRRYPRLRCRDRTNFAACQHRQTLPGFPRDSGWFAAYFTDIGRGGIGLLHGEPLYPKEQLRLMLSDGKLRLVEVVRCERLEQRCYSIGTRFVEPKQ